MPTDELTLALLAKRGFHTTEEIARFLNPSYDEHLGDPLLMKNMPLAAKRLGTAILSRERIAVWSDYDCDGIPGGVLMHDFLKKCGANFENYIPHRHEEGFGLNTNGLEELAKRDAKLLITVDCGIADVGAVKHANKLGMEVIITDHHLPPAELPPAFAIVDPKQEGETYPFRDFCGAGLAWKLVCATLAAAPELREKVPEGWEKWLLDMAGLATIADMVPLTGENRVIAKYGLMVMRKSPRLGLSALCRGMRVDQRTLTEDDVAFMIAPRINAASRMGDPQDAFNLLATDDENEADRLAKKLEAANRQRKAAAGVITRAVRTRLASRTAIPSVIALGDPAWRPALLGLVASGIADEYARPVFLWGREGNLALKGSCRAGDGTHVMTLMGAAVETFVQFGGHADAGGFTVRDDAVFHLEERLAEAYERMERVPEEPLAIADAVIAPEEVTSSFLLKLERLAPFGEGNPKPLFLMRDVEISGIFRFGKGNEHLKLKIAPDDLEAVAFFVKGDLAEAAGKLVRGSRANILAHLERDSFSHRKAVRLRLVELALP